VYKLNCLLFLLDDFFSIDPSDYEATRTMALLTHMFNSLRIPLSHHKTDGPTHILQYLGLTLDTSCMLAVLPDDKKQRIKLLLKHLLLSQNVKKENY
jgi:hypothetical protein